MSRMLIRPPHRFGESPVVRTFPGAKTTTRRGMTMIRTSIIVTVLLCTGALGANAQQPGKMHHIGFLSYFGCVQAVAPNGAFRQTLRSLGYIEGQNIIIDCRDAPGHVDRLPDLAADLVNRKVDLLVTESTAATLAAKRATSTIPI